MTRQGYTYATVFGGIAALTTVAAALIWAGISIAILLVVTLPFSVIAFMSYRAAKRFTS